MGQLGPPVGALDELQISLVPLLQALQQQLVLGPLQLQLLHLGGGRRDGMEGGEAGSLRLPGKPSGPQQDPLPHSPAPQPAAPHLGLQLCQPGLTLQKVSLELSSAALKLHPCSQELPLVFYAWQQAPCQGLWEQGLQERARDVPG